MISRWSIGPGSASKNRSSRPKSVASKAAMLAASSRPTRCRRSGLPAVRMMSAPLERARRVPYHSCAPAAVSPPGDTLGRSRGLRGSAGPVADVRSADTGGEQSWDDAGRPPTSQDPRPPPSSSDVAASVRRSTGSWPTRSPAGAGSPCFGARRAWARARCWVTCPTGSPAGTSRGPSASSRRWSWLMPACTSYARRCWTSSAGCPFRSATRSRRCSAAAPAPRPTGSWWGWPR